MKYCSHCGSEVLDDAIVCVKCGCSVSNINQQAVGGINPNDAPSSGFAVLGFFFPLIGLILWIVWNNTSPLKAKSTGKGALIGVITSAALSILILIITVLGTTGAVIGLNALNKEKNPKTVVENTSSSYIGQRPHYQWYTNLSPIRTRTRDATQYSVAVEIVIGYDENDNVAQQELIARTSELQDFLRSFFSGKYAEELKPENENRLKQEILEAVNTRILTSARARAITFRQLDVMEM
ncbi:hypothetical protein AGMMS49991_09500 [Spirochaetia bacterium]|nr:hypothetical protein AGMMS49991_09500 [Spirochaetia bacterium]